MAALIQARDYSAIRAAIDVTLTTDELPDEVIRLSIYQGAAEAEYQERDPNAGTYAEGTATKLHQSNAVIYLTAARLVLAIPQLTSERFADTTTTVKQIDPEVKASRLRSLAERELRAVLAEATSDQYPTFFTLANGWRNS